MNDPFSCTDEDAIKNPREFYNKVAKQTEDFEIKRLESKAKQVQETSTWGDNCEAEEFIITSNVPFADKHCFFDEQLEEEKSGEKPSQDDDRWDETEPGQDLA